MLPSFDCTEGDTFLAKEMERKKDINCKTKLENYGNLFQFIFY